MQLMLECKKKIGKTLSPEQAHSLTYTELGNVALGRFGKWAVNLAVLACNLGVCAGYMIFISSNLQVATQSAIEMYGVGKSLSFSCTK